MNQKEEMIKEFHMMDKVLRPLKIYQNSPIMRPLLHTTRIELEGWERWREIESIPCGCFAPIIPKRDKLIA